MYEAVNMCAAPVIFIGMSEGLDYIATFDFFHHVNCSYYPDYKFDQGSLLILVTNTNICKVKLCT